MYFFTLAINIPRIGRMKIYFGNIKKNESPLEVYLTSNYNTYTLKTTELCWKKLEKN